MKNLFKKIVTIASIATLSVSMTAIPASATETVRPYACPELNLTVEEVEEIVAGMRELGKEQGLSEQEIDDLVSVWYKNPYARVEAASYQAKDFFVAVPVTAGQIISNNSYVGIKFDTTKMSLLNNNLNNVVLGNAIPSLTLNNFTQSSSTVSNQKTYKAQMKNMPSTTTQSGNLLVFQVNTLAPTSGQYGYQEIKDGLSGFVTSGIQLSDNDYEANVGSLGDINRDYMVNETDLKLLQKYVINTETFSNVQFAAADCNENGIVNITDCSALNTYLRGTSTSLR